MTLPGGTVPDPSPNNPQGKGVGVYVGLISFAGSAGDLTGGVPVFLDAAGKDSLLAKLNSDYTLSSQGGTALFYAVHKALANLKSMDLQHIENLDSVNVITFTDGLDNGSTGSSTVEPIEGQIFDSDNAYTNYLSEQIASRRIAGKPITAYSVGVRGSDVSDTAKFENDLAKIASTGKKQSLADFGSLQSTFQVIADGLQIVHSSTTFTMKTTLLAPGTKVRMTFDVAGTDSADAAVSAKYIEGTITRTGTGSSLVYTFENIQYASGVGSAEGQGPITGTRNGAEVEFTFTGVTGYDPVGDKQMVKQWTKSLDSSVWQVNSEYNIDGATQIDVEKRSSIIYLVLDSSRSLDETKIGQIRSAAGEFISSLYDRLNSGGNSAGDTIKPGTPTSVSAAAQSSSGILVSWSFVSGASSYKVYRSDSASGPYMQVGSPSSSTYMNTGLSPDTTYYYKVKAVNSAGESGYSSYTYATTSSSSSGSAPTGVSAAVQSSSRIQVSWAFVSGASGYKVYRGDSASGPYVEVGSPSISTYTDTGLSSNTTYYYKITAVDNSGESDYSSYTYATTSSSPSAPTGVSAAAQSSGSIRVSWSSVSRASSYKVYRAASPSGPYAEVGSPSSSPYTDTGLSPDTTYYYLVTAVNSAGESGYTSYTSATTSGNAPSAPTGVSAAAQSSSSIRVSWSSVSGASSYKVYRSTSPSGLYAEVGSPSSSPYTDTGLLPDTTYYYLVTAVNSAGESGYTSYTSATTSGSVPSAPTGVSAAAVTSSSIQVSWSSVSGASSYKVYRGTRSSGSYTEVGSSSSSPYTDTGLSWDRTYYYKVKAVNNAGESAYSYYASATTLW
jgi:fibronectin type 3 domain-containing protein